MTGEAVWQEIVFAGRTMRTSPGFVAVAVLALALGIGANAAIFTVINAVLIESLPYDDPDQMVVPLRVRPAGPNRGVSIPKFFAWKEGAADVLADTAVYNSGGPGMSLGYQGEPEQVTAIQVSREFFSLFRMRPAAGRFFSPEEDRPGGPRVAVVSHGLWRRRFAADPRLVNQTVLLGGQPYTIIGIAASFEANPPADLWLPLQPDPATTNHAHFLLGGARLKPGVTIEAANARMRVVAEEFRRRFPNAMAADETAGVVSMRDVVTGDVRPMLLFVWAAVVLVQLIACINVANLLLVRSVARTKELTVRSCLGATRARLVRQLLVESILLAVMSGAVGLVVGRWALRALLALAPAELPRVAALAAGSGLDPAVLGFTLILSLLSGLLFGLSPALHVFRADLNAALKEDTGRGTLSVAHRRAQGTFVVTELALGLVLLVAAGLLIRSALLLTRVEPGVRTENVLTFKTALSGPEYVTTKAVTEYTRKLSDRLESLPGVEAVASVSFLPTEAGPDLSFDIEGRRGSSSEDIGSARWRLVSHRLFEALGIPLLRGRVFGETDAAGAAPVVIINQTMARKYWPGEDPIGQRITIGARLGPRLRDSTREIVGMVGDVREDGLVLDAPPAMYIPQAQISDPFTALTNSLVATSWVVSTAAHPVTLTDNVRRQVTATDSRQAGFDFMPMTQVIQKSLATRRFVLVLLTLFAGTALLLAAIGTYSVFSYLLHQRSHEIAIRLALGAPRQQVMSLLLRHGLTLTAVGVIVGLAGALALSRLLTALLFGVQPTDPQTLIGASSVLVAVAMLATWIPARRATRVDPGSSLRSL